MTAVTAGRVRPWRARTGALAGQLAEAAGKTIGRVQRWSRSLPGIAGAGMVAYGASLAWWPAGFMVGGVFLLMLDRRL